MRKACGCLLLFLSCHWADGANCCFAQDGNSNEASKATASVAGQNEGKKQTDDLPQYPDPNKIPYKTKKSLISHFFSLPARVWRLAWTPLGETVIWVEQNRIHQKAIDFFYLNGERTAAIFPLVSLGGNTGAGGG